MAITQQSQITSNAFVAISDLPELPAALAADPAARKWWADTRQVLRRLFESAANSVPLALAAGAMLKSAYDSNSDGTVNAADRAPWAGISGKPTSFPAATHSHAISDVTGLRAELDALGGSTTGGLGFTVETPLVIDGSRLRLEHPSRTRFLAGTSSELVDAAPQFRNIDQADLPDLSGTYQPLSVNLTALATGSSALYGRGLLLTEDAASLRAAAELGADDDALFASLTTEAPAGSTAKAIKIGSASLAADAPVFTHSLRIEHDGTLYDVMLRSVAP